MSSSPARAVGFIAVRRGAFLRALAAVAGLACGILGAEATFGGLRPAQAPASGSGEPLLYSVEVRTSGGRLLASPLVLRPEGERVHLELAPLFDARSPPVGLSLDLEPRASSDGARLCLAFRLAVSQPDALGVARGSIGVRYGERRTLRLPGAAGRLQLSVAVARPNGRSHGPRAAAARGCA